MPRRGTEFRDDARSNLSTATTAIWPRFLGLTFETLEALISGYPLLVPKLTHLETTAGASPTISAKGLTCVCNLREPCPGSRVRAILAFGMSVARAKGGQKWPLFSLPPTLVQCRGKRLGFSER
jgi:hypothetical protein